MEDRKMQDRNLQDQYFGKCRTGTRGVYYMSDCGPSVSTRSLLVPRFSGPAFSSHVKWSCIFRSCVFLSCNLRSCIIPVFRIGHPFSTRTFCPLFYSALLIQVLHFQSTHYKHSYLIQNWVPYLTDLKVQLRFLSKSDGDFAVVCLRCLPFVGPSPPVVTVESTSHDSATLSIKSPTEKSSCSQQWQGFPYKFNISYASGTQVFIQ